MNILEASLEKIVTYVGRVAAKEAELLLKVREEVDSMMEELNGMNSFLESASQRRDNDPWMKNWVREVRNLAYDTADCIDRFILRARDSRGETLVSAIREFFGTLKSRHQTGISIQDIKTRIKEASARASRYCIPAAAPAGSSSIRKGSHNRSSARIRMGSDNSARRVKEEELVGFDEPRALLISRLLEEETGLSVISVVGMAGLGKTAVVHRVFNDLRVAGVPFDCGAWVVIGKSRETKDLLRQMFNSFFPRLRHEDVNGMDVDQLSQEISDRLADKRYVVVFDNVWDLEAWNIIRWALPDNQKGSRVIVTTQIEKVGQSCSVNHQPVFVYKLPFLTDVSARKLFCQAVFRNPDPTFCPRGLVEHMNRILEKCEGLPRAIVTVSHVLIANNKSKTYWEKQHKHLGASDTDPTLNRMTGILTVCYDYLPYHLRDCFLYLSIFPKKSKIRRNRLVRRFMAEGLVNSGHGKLAEEVAEEYFDEFISRNIIQPSETGADGKVKTGRIHFLLHEIIVSMSVEETFASPLSERYMTTVGEHKVRHLSVHDGSELPRPRLSRVRSLTMSKYNDRVLATSGSLLRVLDLEGCGFLENDDLQYVCKFDLLKYLSLRKTGVTLLPEAIENLRYLQTLDIKDTEVTAVPASIGKTRQLRYLLAGKSDGHDKQKGVQLQRGIGKVKTLRVLAQVDANQSLTELGELTKLRKLGLVGLKKDSGERLFAVLQKLDNSLQSLSVWNSDHRESLEYLHSLPSPPRYLQSLKLGGRLGNLPQWFHKLDNVVKMTLRGTELKDDGMLALQNLQSLLQLVLMDDAYVGNNFRTSEDGFPSLKELHMKNLTKLERVEISEGAAPNLEQLTLSQNVDVKILGNRGQGPQIHRTTE